MIMFKSFLPCDIINLKYLKSILRSAFKSAFKIINSGKLFK